MKEFLKKIKKWSKLFSGEFQRTTSIGQKMISATQKNSELQEAYVELGHLAVESIKSGDLTWNNEKVKNILSFIDKCQKDLSELEDEVKDIKGQSL